MTAVTNITLATPATASRRSKVVVVLPAYNEEANVGKLLDRIREAMEESFLPYQVIVVDDGSVDRTPEILTEYASRMPIAVHRHKVNQGLGSTIRDGLYLAAQTASDHDVVVTMDSDETHSPGLILRMVRMIREGHDVVIASRYQPGARVYGLSAARRLISYLASLACRTIFPTPGVKDFTSGYRAYRGEALKTALAHYGDRFIRTDGFQCMIDILLQLRRVGLIFGEVPMILRYDLKSGQSKMKLFRTARQTIALLIGRRLGKE